MGILELKSIVTKIKRSLDQLTSRVEVTTGEINECWDRSIEIPQPEQWRENGLV